MDPVLLAVIGGIIVVGGGVGAAALARRSSSRRARLRERSNAEIAALEQEAGRALVRADETVRLGGDELGFTSAEFGEADAAEFRDVLRKARTDLAEAFRLNQLLHDENPDTDEERRRYSSGVIALCTGIEQSVRAQSERVAGLRAARRRAPDAISDARGRIQAVRAEVEPARATVSDAERRYAMSALAPVARNVEQAERLLEFAERSLGVAEQRHSTGRVREADRAIEAATESIARAAGLLESVNGFEMEALAAESTLTDVIEDSRGDIAAARTLAAEASSPELQRAIDRLEHETDAASRRTGPSDPFTALTALREANSALDRVVAGIAARRADAERLRTQLGHAVDDAHRQIQAARQIVDDYRSPVGPDARTRLSEAQRLVDEVPTIADQQTALQQARRSASLAAEAAHIAQDELRGGRGYDDQRYGGRGRGGSGDVLGAVLGGMVIGGILDDIGDMGDIGDFFD